MSDTNDHLSARICRIAGQVGAIAVAVAGGCWLWVEEFLWLGVGIPAWDWSDVAPVMGPTVAVTCAMLAVAMLPDARRGLRAFRAGAAARISLLLATEATFAVTGLLVTNLGPTVTRHTLTTATVIRGLRLDRGSIVSESTSGTRVELPPGVRFAGGRVAPFVIPTESPDGPGVISDFSVDLPANTTIYGVACLGGAGRSAHIARGSDLSVQCVSQGQIIDGVSCDRGATVLRWLPRGVACRSHFRRVMRLD